MPHSKTKVLLHIGTQKTGTTSIQRVLCAHSDLLESASVLYPFSGRPHDEAIKYGHHDLAREAIQLALGKRPQTNVLAGLLSEIEAKKPDRVIISSEDFWHPHNQAPLAEVLGEFTTDIVVSLRRQDEYLNAMYYTTLCAERHGLSPEEYAAGEVRHLLDYLTILDNWRRAFPRARLTVRLYDRGLPPRNDAIGDFLRVAGLDHLIPEGARRLRVHSTLPARAVAALRVLAKTDLSPLDFFSIFDAAHLALQGSKEEPFSYSPSFRMELLRGLRGANAELRRKYYDDSPAPLFAETPHEPDEQWRAKMTWGDEAVRRLLLDISNAFRMRVYAPGPRASS